MHTIKLYSVMTINGSNVDDDEVRSLHVRRILAESDAIEFCLDFLADGAGRKDVGNIGNKKLLALYEKKGWPAFYDAWRDIRDARGIDAMAQIQEWEFPLSELLSFDLKEALTYVAHTFQDDSRLGAKHREMFKTVQEAFGLTPQSELAEVV